MTSVSSRPLSSTGPALEVLIIGNASLTVQSYTSVLTEIRQSLQEVDRLAMPGHVARVEWGIRELSGGKDARIVLSPTHRPARRAEETLNVSSIGYVEGLQNLSDEPAIPRYFSPSTVQRVQRIGDRIEQGRLAEVRITSLDEHRTEAVVDEGVLHKARKAVVAASQAWSSVTGRLDVLAAKNAAKPRGEITLPSRRAVLFTGVPQQIPQLREAWGKTVTAGGILTRNSVGQAVRLDLMELRIHDDTEVASAVDLLGVAPNYTGALSTTAYIEELRHG